MYEHIEKLIAMYDDIVAFEQTITYPDDRRSRHQVENNELQFKLAKMLSHINRNFIPKSKSNSILTKRYLDEEEVIAVNQMFNKGWTYTVEHFRDIPPVLMDVVIPIAIARLLISNGTHNIQINPNYELLVNGKTTYPWNDFVSAYAILILKT